MRTITGRIGAWAMAAAMMAGCLGYVIPSGAAEDAVMRETGNFFFFGGEDETEEETKEGEQQDPGQKPADGASELPTEEASQAAQEETVGAKAAEEKETEGARPQDTQGNMQEPKQDDSLETRYRLFRDKIRILETVYGSPQIAQLNEYEYTLEGLCYAALVDLEGSGKPQLVTVHVAARSSASEGIQFERVYEIWDVAGGRAVLLDWGKLFETEGGFSATILYGDSRISFPITAGSAADFEGILKTFYATKNTLGMASYDGSAILSGRENYAEIISASASSELPPEDGLIYFASCAVDGDLATAWTENAEGTGRGEWLQLQFLNEQAVTAVVINPGYQKTHDTYVNNCFPVEISMEFSDGTKQNYKVARNDWIGSTITLPVGQTVRATWVRITILKADQGALWEDNCISEIKVLVKE
ncbi:MAG: discoidin domain-containing protein [Verrucomicrobia bacterium]|nr:discoidin domain-containing protein [Verrucomicrobiota bacterium]